MSSTDISRLEEEISSDSELHRAWNELTPEDVHVILGELEPEIRDGLLQHIRRYRAPEKPRDSIKKKIWKKFREKFPPRTEFDYGVETPVSWFNKLFGGPLFAKKKPKVTWYSCM